MTRTYDRPLVRGGRPSRRAVWDFAVWPIAAPAVFDGTSAVGESRHRIPGASVGQPTELCLSEQIGTSLREAKTLVHHEPAALNREVQASPYSAGVPFSRSRNGPLIFSIWMRPSCTASVLLAISRILRAGLSGSE